MVEDWVLISAEPTAVRLVLRMAFLMAVHSDEKTADQMGHMMVAMKEMTMVATTVDTRVQQMVEKKVAKKDSYLGKSWVVTSDMN